MTIQIKIYSRFCIKKMFFALEWCPSFIFTSGAITTRASQPPPQPSSPPGDRTTAITGASSSHSSSSRHSREAGANSPNNSPAIANHSPANRAGMVRDTTIVSHRNKLRCVVKMDCCWTTGVSDMGRKGNMVFKLGCRKILVLSKYVVCTVLVVCRDKTFSH